MRGVRAQGSRVEVTDEPARSGEGTVMRVSEAGICGSDLHMIESGSARRVMGHEFGGMVDGTLVAVRPTGACNSCDACKRGFPNACSQTWATAYGIGRDGGLADEVLVDPARIYPMPAGARPVDAALVEPLAVTVHGVRRGRPDAGSRALVVGAGSIGLLTVAALRVAGVEVDIVSRHRHQSEAAEALGAQVVDPGADTSYMSVFDAVCTQQTLDACVQACRPGGTVVEFGMFWGSVSLTNAWMFKEVSLVPAMAYSHHHDHDDFEAAALLAGTDPTIADALVTHVFPLADAPEAFRTAADRSSGAIKVHLVP